MSFRTLLVTISVISVAGCFLMFVDHQDRLVRGRALSKVASNNRFQQTNGLELPTITKNTTTAKPERYFHQPTLPFRLTCSNVKCMHGRRVLWRMVVFVKSTAPNFYRRALIRRTWGSWCYVEGGLLRVVFVVGKADNRRTADLLHEESSRNGDILNYDGPDNYRNIAIKTLTGMRWASENLPDHYLYSSADDDFLVDLGALQESIVENDKKFGTAGFPIICTFHLLTAPPVERDPKSKWYVSKDEYKWDTFPRSCLGGMYTMSVGLARRLWEEARAAESPMRVDDVWITGILREKLCMPEEMVVKAAKTVAVHFTGYKGKRAKNIRSFMSKDWVRVYRRFKHKALC